MKTKLSIILLAAFLLAACGPKSAPTPAGTLPPITQPPSSTATTAPAPLSGEIAVNIAGFAFDPAVLTVKVGTTITWTNRDSAPHTVTANDNSWGSGDLAQGDSFSFIFAQAETFAYHCGVHPTMKATVTVVP